MTVEELCEKLSQFSKDKEIKISITGIIDNYGFLINGYAPIQNIYFDNFSNKIFISGEDENS